MNVQRTRKMTFSSTWSGRWGDAHMIFYTHSYVLFVIPTSSFIFNTDALIIHKVGIWKYVILRKLCYSFIFLSRDILMFFLHIKFLIVIWEFYDILFILSKLNASIKHILIISIPYSSTQLPADPPITSPSQLHPLFLVIKKAVLVPWTTVGGLKKKKMQNDNNS